MKIGNNIILGGAQFGMDYGSTQYSKRINFKNLSKILNFAYKNKINTIDTASTYGVSEKKIGFYLSNNYKKKFRIYTKIPKINSIEKKSGKTITSIIEKNINKSLKLLKISQVEGLAIHDTDDFFKRKKIFLDCIKSLKKKRKIKNFGISIYNPTELKKIYKLKELNFIQLPINILDNRWDDRLLNKIKKNGIKIFARSIFLRGLLFFKKNQKWPISNKEKNEIKTQLNYLIQKFSKKNVIEITFAYLNSLSFLNGTVCGFNSMSQFKQINKLRNIKKLKISQKNYIKSKFTFVNRKILDGRNY